MQYYNLSWEEALHLVQNRRYCISPNGGFLVQLKVSILYSRHATGCSHSKTQEYEAIYRATQASALNALQYGASAPAFDPNGQQHQAPVGQRRKRDDEDDDDEFDRAEDRKRATMSGQDVVRRVAGLPATASVPTYDPNAMEM